MASPLFRKFFGSGTNLQPAWFKAKKDRSRGNLADEANAALSSAVKSAIGKALGSAVADAMAPDIAKMIEKAAGSKLVSQEVHFKEWEEHFEEMPEEQFKEWVEPIRKALLNGDRKLDLKNAEEKAARERRIIRTDAFEAPDYAPILEGPISVTSSNVHSIAYEHNQNDSYAPGNLLVRYLGGDSKHRTGEGPLYRYHDVPVTLWKSFKLAASKGIFVWDHLRVRGTISGHQYAFSLIGVGDDNYVPRAASLKRGKQGEWYLNRKFGDLSSTLPERQARGGRGDLTADFSKRAAEMKMLKAGRR